MSEATLLPGQRPVPPRVRTTPSNTGAFARSLAFSAVRGAGLIALAVVIGVVLLNVVDTGNKGPIGDGGKAKATPASSSTKGSTSTTTTGRQAAVRPPAQVQVLVLNGSDTVGAAKAMTQKLQPAGYQTLPPTDGPKRTGTVVWFTPGFERECTALATAVGGAPKVEAVPNPPPAGTDRANCVVVIGK